MNPKISVIMSVYNNDKFLKDAIESVLNQSYDSFEFIITNDNSSDKTLSIIEEYAKKDNRIIVINNLINLGLTKSLNQMIEISSGKYIARMDGDDICENLRFMKQVEKMEIDNKIDLIFSSSVLIDGEGNEICESWRPSKINKILQYLPLYNFITHPSVMIKTDVIKSYLYNQDFITGQDKELWLRLFKDKKNFFYMKEPLIKYRINDSSVRNKKKVRVYFNLANQCINNRKKFLAFKYFKNLNTIEKAIILIKIIIPHSILFHRGLLIRKMRKTNI
jgi:glycosyltransferase involved in cell wall biosynthesis